MWKMKWKKWAGDLFVGEISIRKSDLWFVAGLCLLAGVVCGLFAAPLTHGVTVWSNNQGMVKGDGNIYKVGEEDEACGEEEE